MPVQEKRKRLTNSMIGSVKKGKYSVGNVISKDNIKIKQIKKKVKKWVLMSKSCKKQLIKSNFNISMLNNPIIFNLFWLTIVCLTL